MSGLRTLCRTGWSSPADSNDLSYNGLSQAERVGAQPGREGLAVADRADRVRRRRPVY